MHRLPCTEIFVSKMHCVDSIVPSFSLTPAACSLVDKSGDDDIEDQIAFPLYDENFKPVELLVPPRQPRSTGSFTVPRAFTGTFIPIAIMESSGLVERVADDSAVQPLPSRHVNYLSHNWKEEDIWSSWRFIVSKRKGYDNSVRLENASWRT